MGAEFQTGCGCDTALCEHSLLQPYSGDALLAYRTCLYCKQTSVDIRSLSTVWASGTGPCTHGLCGGLHRWPDGDIWGSPWHHRPCSLGSSLSLAPLGSFSIVPFCSLLKGCQPDLSLLCCQLLLLALKGNLLGGVLARQPVAAALPGLPLP